MRKIGFAPLAMAAFLLGLPSVYAVDWTSFQDPIEKAFTVDVPRGWTVKGGLFRLGYSDNRPMIDLKSPDGKINVRLGDVTIPAYCLPDRFHPREGEVYDLGAQARMTVAKYRTGQQFAVLYAKTRFHGLCQTLQPQPAGDGEAIYNCDGNRTAYVHAKTALNQGIWQVQVLASFIAPTDQVPLARSIVERCEKSSKLNDAWIQYQKRMDEEALVYQRARQKARMRALSQQVAQFEMKMQAMQTQVNAFEHRQAAQAAQVETWGNILTGITPTIDPLGNPKDVWTGPKSRYWTDGTRVVNSDVSPGAGWQEMKPRQ